MWRPDTTPFAQKYQANLSVPFIYGSILFRSFYGKETNHKDAKYKPFDFLFSSYRKGPL